MSPGRPPVAARRGAGGTRRRSHGPRGLGSARQVSWTAFRGVRRMPPWRTFCKAMASFTAGDDRGLERAVRLLPEGFALSGTVAELKRCAGGGEVTGPAAVQQELGTDDALVAATAARLRQALQRGDEPQIVHHLVSLADVVYPENPLAARIDLLMIAARGMFRELGAGIRFLRSRGADSAGGVLHQHHDAGHPAAPARHPRRNLGSERRGDVPRQSVRAVPVPGRSGAGPRVGAGVARPERCRGGDSPGRPRR